MKMTGELYRPSAEAQAIMDLHWQSSGSGRGGVGTERWRPGPNFALSMVRMQIDLIRLYLPGMDARTRARALITLSYLDKQVEIIKKRLKRAEKAAERAVAAAAALAA